MAFIKYVTVLITAGVLSLSFMSITFAHSYVEESEPAEGSTVDEDIDTINLTFDAGIESATTVTVSDDEGEEYDIVDESVESPEYSATLAEPLPSGDYTIEWEALGEDGHTTEDDIAFTVNSDDAADEDDESENGTENVVEDDPGEEEASEDEITIEEDLTQEETAADETTEEGGAGWIMVAVLALIIIGAFVFFISRRNKT